MTNFKYIISFILLFLVSEMTLGECLLPDAESFSEFVKQLEKRDDWGGNKLLDNERFSRYKFKSKVDSLLRFATKYFEEKLPEEIICAQVNVDNAWFSFYNYQITMKFTFFFDAKKTTPQSDGITVLFNYYHKTNHISVYTPGNVFKVPNCNNFPDSCKFIVKSENAARYIAKQYNFLDENFSGTYSKQNKYPFHFEILKPIDDDCGMQSLYINVYNKDTIISPPYINSYCETWKDKINYSEIVIDGTIIENDAFSVNGKIYSKVKIEVHHLFKGKSIPNIISVITEGGSLFDHSLSYSHGQINLGFNNQRFIFFLGTSNSYNDLIAINKLLGYTVYQATVNPLLIPLIDQKKIFYRTTEEFYKRIEKITGTKRKILLHPKTINEEILKTCRTIPDRKPGLSAILSTFQDIKYPDTANLFLFISGTNTFHYLEKWNLSLSYDTIAFGSWLVKNKKLSIQDQLNKNYEFTIKDKNENSIILSWRHITNKKYIEFPIIANYSLKVLNLKIPIENKLHPMNLKITFNENPIAKDLFTNESYELINQFTSSPIQRPFQIYKHPNIIDIVPREGAIGDTITIIGNNFDNSKLLFSGKNYSLSENHFPIDKHFILSHTNTKFVFIIPPFLEYDSKMRNLNHTQASFPISGNIFFVLPNGQRFITKLELKILTPRPDFMK